MNRKIIVPLLLASMAGGVVATTTNRQVLNVYADQTVTNLVGSTIELTGFNNSGKTGQEYILPSYNVLDENGAVVNGAEVTVSITDPNNKVLNNINVNGSFVPAISGTYTVVYTAKSDNTLKTVSQALKINVTGENFVINLPKNSKYVIPGVIPTSTTNALKIPVPTITDSNGDDVDVETSETKGLRVYVVAVNNDGSDRELELVDGSYYEWMPTKAGAYEIVYKYIDGNVKDIKNQRFLVKEADKFNTQDINLQFAYEGSVPTTAVLGVELELPKIKGTDKKSGSSVEVYTDIKIVHVGTQQVFEHKDFKFTPTLKGEYRVTYKATNEYFGKESASHSFIITNVKDTLSPEFTPVNNYDFDEETGEVTKVYNKLNEVVYDKEDHLDKTLEERKELSKDALSDLRHAVPSIVVLEATGDNGIKEKTISIPAAFATDNVSDVSNITFTRIVRNSTSSIQEPITDTAFNKAANYTFNKAGNYTIRYIVKDQAGNEKTTMFDVKVVNSLDELKDAKTTVSLVGVAPFAYEGSKVTFNAPTASDNYDSRLEVNTFFRYDNEAASVRHALKADKNGKMTIKLDNVPAGAESIIVYAEAINDYGVTKTVQSTIKVIRIDDFDAPKFETGSVFAKLAEANEETLGAGAVINAEGLLVSTGKAPFDQTENNVIKLPSLNITDGKDPNLEITVIVRNPNGGITNIRNSKVTSTSDINGYTYNISGGEFTAVYAGTYEVTYTAKDAGGNITLRTFGIKVRDTQAPSFIFTNEDFFAKSYELGQFIAVPTAGLMDNGQVITDLATEKKETTPGSGEYLPGIRWEVKEGVNYTTKGVLGFYPLAEGTYTIVYTGWDTTGAETISREFTLTVADTIKPTITLETEYTLPSAVEFNKDITNTIKLPAVTLFDGVRGKEIAEDNFEQTEVSDISLVVKVTDSNGNEVTVSQLEEVSFGGTVTRYTFEATKQNIYTIKYIATDSSGNISELVKTVEVGDVVAPTLTWKDDYEIPTTLNLNSTFELNMSKSEISDDSDEVIKPVVTLIAPDGKTVTSLVTDEYKWKFDQVGSYTLRITLKDDAGNENPYTYTITVSEKEAAKQVISEWLGTTIIVVSVAIFGGLIAYFAFTSKVNKSGNKRRTTKK